MDDPELTFRPFAMLPTEELRREEAHWRSIVHSGGASATRLSAQRHMERCIETLRERGAG